MAAEPRCPVRAAIIPCGTPERRRLALTQVRRWEHAQEYPAWSKTDDVDSGTMRDLVGAATAVLLLFAIVGAEVAIVFFAPWTRLSSMALRPKGQLHSRLLSARGLSLAAAFLLLWALVALGFAFGYWALGVGPDLAQTPDADGSFQAVLYHSFQTQILGDGSFTVGGQAGWFMSAGQSILGTTILAVGFGLIVLRVTERGHAFEFAPNLRYTPRRGGKDGGHVLEVWAFNEDSRTLIDPRVTMGIEVPVQRYRLRMERQATVLPAMQGMMFRTVEVPRTDIAEAQQLNPSKWNRVHLLSETQDRPETQDRRTLLDPDRDKDGWRVRVEIRASIVGTGRQLVVTHEYKMGDIFCGYWGPKNHDERKALEKRWHDPDWRKRPWRQFGELYTWNDQPFCDTCELQNGCWLDAKKRELGRGADLDH